MSERTFYALQEKNQRFKDGVNWDVLASNGGLGSVPKPKPFKPSHSYISAPKIVPIDNRLSPSTSRTLDAANVNGLAMQNLNPTMTPKQPLNYTRNNRPVQTTRNCNPSPPSHHIGMPVV